MKSIKIKKEHKKFLKPLIRNVNVAKDGVMLANEIHTRAKKELWEVLKEEYPEIVDRGVSFDHPEDGEWELVLYGEEKSIPELLGEAAALEQRIKTLEEEIEEKTDELVEEITKEEEAVEETKIELLPSEPTKDKDLESPPG